MIDIKRLSDAAVTKLLHRSVRMERKNGARVVKVLAEFDRRRLQERTKYPSLFAYCTKVLRYSEDEACFRINASRKSATFPEVVDLLASGELTLSTINKLAPILKTAQDAPLLQKARGLSAREVEALVAEVAPRKETREVRRELGRQDSFALSAREAAASAPLSAQAASAPAALPPQEERVYYGVTVSKSLDEKIAKCKLILGNKYGKVKLEHVLAEAVEAFLELKDRDRRIPARIRPSDPRSRRIPEWVKQEVWERDGGRCAALLENGSRCENRDYLEYDHVRPWALGGVSNDPANIRLHCRPHNQARARGLLS